MKARILLLLSIVSVSFSACKKAVYIDELEKKAIHIDKLEKREDGRYYKVGEDKPYTGSAKSDVVNADWEFHSGTQVHSNSYYENGKKRFEEGREGFRIQYYDPQGNKISSDEYGEKYTPYHGYE